MPSLRLRSFEARIFVAILVVALVPAAIALAGGTLTLRSVGTTFGTLGAWDSVAESGRELMESLDEAGVGDPAVSAAAERHREALSESVRLSRVYAFLADRFVGALPVAAILATVLVVGLALLTARRLARTFAAPVTDLVGWTERIARGDPLPTAGDHDRDSVEELRALRGALRDMAGELEDGRRREVEAARLRSWTDLARSVAHELKNPLTSMKMAAAALTGGSRPIPEEAGRVLVEEIDRLDRIARTFAQHGKLPEGPRSDVDVTELLESLAGRHRGPEVEILVEASGTAIVHAHLDALRRAFENLLLNAVEAQEGADDARVEMRVGTSDGEVEVEISDRGSGVPEELLEEIWNPDVTTKRSGTGLGLAIVRQIVLLHEGSITVENRPGGGATFRVRLPLIEASAE